MAESRRSGKEIKHLSKIVNTRLFYSVITYNFKNKLHPNQNTRRSIQSASPNFLSVPGFNNNDSKRSSILSANEQISTQCSHAVLLPVPQLKTVKEQPNYRQRPYLQSAVNFVRKWFRTENLINLFAGSSHPSNSNENSSPQRRLQLQTETNYPGFVY